MVENQITPFLQRLPKQLNKRQRIILEAIDISAESIELSMHRIQQLSLDVVGRDGDPNFSATERSMLFLDAWGIVDRAHNIRTLLKCGQPSIAVGEGITFDTEASKGSLMRNAMDHLADNMGYIVEKDRSPPIYGIITFVWA